MKFTIIGCMLLIVQLHGQDHLKTMDEVKRWTLPVSSGTLTLKLSSYASAGKPSDTVLSVHLDPADGSIASRDLVPGIAQVLREMPSLGYDPARLVMISTSLQQSEYRNGVDQAVQQSGVWKSCIRTKYCHSAEPVANKNLESVSAYTALDSSLAAVGLRRVNTTTGDMTCGRAETDRITCGGVLYISTSSGASASGA